ncbi:MAG: phospholipid scramblase-related protein [Fuerstiella sp.]
MHPVLNGNLFLVKEHVGMFKAANNYDVYDPATGEIIIHCRELRLGMITKMLRFTDYKTMTPFHVDLHTPDGEAILSVRRGIPNPLKLFMSQVQVLDEDDDVIGEFRQKMFSLGGAFRIMNPDGEEMCQLKGKWTGFNFRFLAGDREFAQVTKKWTGLGKELFTSADNYVLQIDESVPPDNPIRQLIMAAVMCIDMVLKER